MSLLVTKTKIMERKKKKRTCLFKIYKMFFLANNKSHLTILSHQMYTFYMFQWQEIQFLHFFFLPSKNLTLSTSAWSVNDGVTKCPSPPQPPITFMGMCFWLLRHLLFLWRGSNAYYSPGIWPPITESSESAADCPHEDLLQKISIKKKNSISCQW